MTRKVFKKFSVPVWKDYNGLEWYTVKWVWHVQIPHYQEHCIVDVNAIPRTYWKECTLWNVLIGKLGNLFVGE